MTTVMKKLGEIKINDPTNGTESRLRVVQRIFFFNRPYHCAANRKIFKIQS